MTVGDVRCRLEGGRFDGLLGHVESPVPALISVIACPMPESCGCRAGAHYAPFDDPGGEPYRLVGFDGSTALYRHAELEVGALGHDRARELVPA